MMRSLSSAVAGLRAHQTKMDVIGNNIANVNTYGFKSSRTTFADVYYQNLSNASAPSTAKGGTNPSQIGYGATVATIDVLNTQSGAASTDRALDVYIAGDGFIASKDGNGNIKYIRLGILNFDAVGNLVDSRGNPIMGFPMDSSKDPAQPMIPADGKIDSSGALREIKIDPKLVYEFTGISISPTGAIVGLLAGETEGKFDAMPDGITDATLKQGSLWQGGINMQITAPFNPVAGLGNMTYTNAAKIKQVGTGPDDPASYTFKFDPATGKAGIYSVSNIVPPATTSTETLLYEADYTGAPGEKLSFKDVTTREVVMTTTVDTTAPAATVANVATGAYQARAITTDKGGNPVVTDFQTLVTGKMTFGDLTVSFDTTKMKVPFANEKLGQAKPGDGKQINIGNIAIAKFPNSAGMQEAGDSYFLETSNSGEPIFVVPGLEGTGGVSAGYLEMSNVDISKEFTEMITTQRGFQANTRIVTVSDEMLQELVNLKR